MNEQNFQKTKKAHFRVKRLYLPQFNCTFLYLKQVLTKYIWLTRSICWGWESERSPEKQWERYPCWSTWEREREKRYVCVREREIDTHTERDVYIYGERERERERELCVYPLFGFISASRHWNPAGHVRPWPGTALHRWLIWFITFAVSGML